MSKSTFQWYYTHIIVPYRDQITLLRLSNQFIFYLLNDLASLPCLFSLVIIPIDDVEHKNNLYRMIFRLPVLKYCKVTFDERYSSEPLKMANNSEVSPIKNLTINSPCCINELIALLSYVPQIRRLLCYNLSQLSNIQIQEQSIVLNNLTHSSQNERYFLEPISFIN